MDFFLTGTFYVNANNRVTMTKNVVATFTLHEGSPGHHMQAVLTSKMDLPKFLKYPAVRSASVPSTFPSYSGYGEGWGLYSEYLGHELGVYENEPQKELGQIMGDLLRSARCMVDTGKC